MKTEHNIISIAEFISNDELLDFAVKNDNIDLVGIRNEYENMKREQYLEQHNHTVWQSNDGKWRTYLDDVNSPRGYVLKVRTTEKAIKDLIIKYYKDKELNPYIDQVFNEWNNQRLYFGEISKQSHNRYLNDFKRFFPKDCLLRQKKFRQITEKDIETFIKTTIHEKKLSAKTYSGLRTIIRGIFKYGKKENLTTISIDADVDESIVAEQMGHSDIATTKRFYYRSNKNDNTKFEQISKALSC